MIAVRAVLASAGLDDPDLDGGFGGDRRGGSPNNVLGLPCPLVGNGALGVLEPTGVGLIVRGQALTDLHDGKHPPHLDRAELAEARHHGQCIVGEGHLHLAHFGHSG